MSEALASLALRCLGPPSVRLDGRDAPPDVVWRKHLALLAYLALSPDTTRARSHLVGLLWAESPEDKARRSLNESFFFQAEDGIRDLYVTGVQTCALPI